MKRTIGIALTVIGSALALSGLHLGVTKYNLSSPHDLSKFLGSLGVSVLILIAGVAVLLNRKPGASDTKKEPPRRSRVNSRRG